MSLNLYNIKKWGKMIVGKSILHVNQGVGKIYSTTDIKGYYNDLTEKVLKDKYHYEVKLPTTKIENGSEILFPIAIFQYGLGAYDLYLLEKKELFLDKFDICVEWAISNQGNDGSWNNFFYNQPYAPYSSMAQGEGASLLIRAYKEFKNERYLLAANRAIEFMLKPLEKGGTAEYINDEVFLKEFTNKPIVLNGWIFSLFGLYDYLKIDNAPEKMSIYNRSILTLINHIKHFDNGYWSKYDLGNKLSSPFYHSLHISQLKALYDLTHEEVFMNYENKWQAYEDNPFNKKRAFIVKAYQKIIE